MAEVTRGQRMADRFVPQGILLVPPARPVMQLRHGLGLLVCQVRAEHICEEMVIAIPLATVVERDQEQIGPVDRLEHGLASVLLGDGVAQRPCQSIQH